ncbi:uncharacterized protein BDR25DRAFT_319265 [Lindgomyces ingoldianus]|uniref:Uncharacterized protein n=1 Tax=Lindgomyces ingoldianus TaxID=673940 RepID=A0ACB6QBI0_9PLEO|nr:uncharacterized protein BDR25DRAFT_319265 [Lindgomyces ingoldianus]KAF2464399.1 hypothetical protein BDR25DRAFT_319265 [Lindgomyces ingoldianus]
MFPSSFFPVVLALGAAYASPVTTVPSAPLITPAPLIPRSLGSFFVGYAMFDDGSTPGGARTCNDYCVTNLIFASASDRSPAWMVGCATQSYGLKLLHVSKEDLPTGGASLNSLTPTQASTSMPRSPVSSAFLSFTTAASTTAPSLATLSHTSSPDPPKKNNAPVIGGAVAGSLILLGLIGAGAFFFFSNRRVTAPNTPYQGPDQAVAMPPAPAPPQATFSPPPAYGQPLSAPIPGYGDGKRDHVAEYRVPEMTHHEVHGQSTPLSAAPMPVYNQSLLGAVDPNTNRRSELS